MLWLYVGGALLVLTMAVGVLEVPRLDEEEAGIDALAERIGPSRTEAVGSWNPKSGFVSPVRGDDASGYVLLTIAENPCWTTGRSTTLASIVFQQHKSGPGGM